jgi:8-oxo-dGTP pyrophosphatase MutT (NUDIX family)
MLTIEETKRRLSAPLPGLPAQLRMSTRPRTSREDHRHAHPPKEGAVLILLYPVEGQLFFPLTRRTENVAHHKGQISLPGGARDNGDGSFWQVAVREAEEELAVEGGMITCLCALTPLYIPSSNFDIHPFVGHVPTRPAFRLNLLEVAELIEMPLDLLLDPAAKQQETRSVRGQTVQVPLYRYHSHQIWGATAMVLSEFEAMLNQEPAPV